MGTISTIKGSGFSKDTRKIKGIKMKTLVIILILSIGSAIADTKVKANAENCKGINKEIKKINEKMRAGYTLREGEKLKEKLRDLERRLHTCRVKGFSTK